MDTSFNDSILTGSPSIRSSDDSTRRFWWVNQNQTYKQEVGEGFLWSPKVKSNGARNPYYDYMKEVSPGDVIFSFCDTHIKAVGVAGGFVETRSKPKFGKAGDSWSQEGWYVPVQFAELHSTIRPKDHIAQLLPTLPGKHSPLQASGHGKQAVYLAPIPDGMADVLIGLIGQNYASALQALWNPSSQEGSIEEKLTKEIIERTDIGPTEKQQLITARRGQGIFRWNVSQTETQCRVTGITQPNHLRASHIKPWKVSSDSERLSGDNGLLLAPHIDHLFDQGYISFLPNGDVLVSHSLDKNVLSRWGVQPTANVGKFKPEQEHFLAYHRAEIFKK